MPARLSTLQARLLPHGPLDVVRQVLLFMAAYQLYRLTRGLVNHPEAATAAFQNARDLIGIERSLNLFVEPSVQAFTSGQQWLLDAASWMYINAQTSVTVGALAWLYLFRNESFYFVRNMFLIAFGIALIGYARSRPRRRGSSPSTASSTRSRTSPASRRTASRSTTSSTRTRPCPRCTSRSRS